MQSAWSYEVKNVGLRVAYDHGGADVDNLKSVQLLFTTRDLISATKFEFLGRFYTLSWNHSQLKNCSKKFSFPPISYFQLK